MIILYLLLIIALSIFEICSLKKNGQIKDIFVFLGCMVIAAAFGIVFLLNPSQPSITSYIFNVLDIEG